MPFIVGVNPTSLGRRKTFTYTTVGNTSEVAVSLSGIMLQANKISLMMDLNDGYVEFDGVASTSSLLIPAGTGYEESACRIRSNITVINAAAGENCRLRGVLWGV